MPGNLHTSYGAYLALVNRIKTIAGATSGHWTDLRDRVFTRMHLPEEDQVRTFAPYVCIPIDKPSAKLVWDEATVVRDHWTVNIYGFVSDGSKSLKEGKAVERSLKLKDDIFDALMQDWKLGGAVDNSTILGWDLVAGDDLDVPYGELVVGVELQMLTAREGLGP